MGGHFKGDYLMKFTAQFLSALAAGGLLLAAMGPAPAVAGAKKKETDIFKVIEADLKRIDKAIVGFFTPPKK